METTRQPRVFAFEPPHLGIERLDGGQSHTIFVQGIDELVAGTDVKRRLEILGHRTDVARRRKFGLVAPGRDRERDHRLQDLLRVDRREVPLGIAIADPHRAAPRADERDATGLRLRTTLALRPAGGYPTHAAGGTGASAAARAACTASRGRAGGAAGPRNSTLTAGPGNTALPSAPPAVASAA